MTDAERPHRKKPTEAELAAAVATEDYGGVPVSDEELADVWTSAADQPSVES